MAIYDYLPKFHVLEPNMLKGLQPGFVEALTDVKSTCTLVKKGTAKPAPSGDKGVLENGHLFMFGAESNGKVVMDLWTAEPGSNPTMFISFAEPINTLFESDSFYATDLNSEKARFVQLIPGDEWTTDIDYSSDDLYSSVWSEMNKHVKEITAETNPGDAWFACTTMADGVTKAHHYKYIG